MGELLLCALVQCTAFFYRPLWSYTGISFVVLLVVLRSFLLKNCHLVLCPRFGLHTVLLVLLLLCIIGVCIWTKVPMLKLWSIILLQMLQLPYKSLVQYVCFNLIWSLFRLLRLWNWLLVLLCNLGCLLLRLSHCWPAFSLWNEWVGICLVQILCYVALFMQCICCVLGLAWCSFLLLCCSM